MGEDGRGDGGQGNFVFHNAVMTVADPEHAVRMMPSAPHAVDHMKKLTEAPLGAVAPPEYRSIQHGGIRHATAGKQAATLPADGHERLVLDE